jgi:hypothetical protein
LSSMNWKDSRARPNVPLTSINFGIRDRKISCRLPTSGAAGG